MNFSQPRSGQWSDAGEPTLSDQDGAHGSGEPLSRLLSEPSPSANLVGK